MDNYDIYNLASEINKKLEDNTLTKKELSDILADINEILDYEESAISLLAAGYHFLVRIIEIASEMLPLQNGSKNLNLPYFICIK